MCTPLWKRTYASNTPTLIFVSEFVATESYSLNEVMRPPLRDIDSELEEAIVF